MDPTIYTKVCKEHGHSLMPIPNTPPHSAAVYCSKCGLKIILMTPDVGDDAVASLELY